MATVTISSDLIFLIVPALLDQWPVLKTRYHRSYDFKCLKFSSAERQSSPYFHRDALIKLR